MPERLTPERLNRRPIAILTDFGTTDAYVGVMKGVILARCPGAQIVDLTHGVRPQDVRAGALYLRSAVPYFPEDTVFLAVVDPGVGGERRALCLSDGHRLFVGPDNGVLWPAAALGGTAPSVYRLDRPQFWLSGVSATFHGRDIFAPVAAALAAGISPGALGTPIENPLTLQLPVCREEEGGIIGEVLLIDHYGNAVTNIRPADLLDPAPGYARFRFAGTELRGPATHYAAAAPGTALVVLGSFGYYEIAVNQESAATRFELKAGDPVFAGRMQQRQAV